MIIIFLSLICIVFSTSCASSRAMKTEQAVTLVVIDYETGLPIPDITVYYQFRKLRYIWFGLEVKYLPIDIRKLVTNNNGEITVPAGNYFLSLHEEFYAKSFYINIGKKNKEILDRRDFHDISSFLITETKKENINFINNIIFINPNYYATAVHIFNDNENREKTDFTTNYLWYQIEAPFDEEIRVTVKLVRK